MEISVSRSGSFSGSKPRDPHPRAVSGNRLKGSGHVLTARTAEGKTGGTFSLVTQV